jgi:uncharacterized protein
MLEPDPTATLRPPAQEQDETARDRSLTLLTGILFALIVLSWTVRGSLLDQPALQTWTTVVVAVLIQAIPFLVLGVTVAAAIAAFVSPSAVARILPQRPAAAVPVAGLAGMALPGCECASVPIAGSLVRRGMTPAAALTFLLAAPAVNPVVLVSTAVAFPGRPEMVGARFAASFTTAVVMGWWWLARGHADRLRIPRPAHGDDASRWEVFTSSMRHDFLHAGGFLVVGAMIAATLNVFVPTEWMDSLAENLLLSVLVMALLAVLMAVCSESDAFIAASLNTFPATAQLAFMVVGPAVDVKLVSLQVGTFGRSFAQRFAPATLVVAIAASLVFGGLLL